MRGKPWFPFYPAVWFSDSAIDELSLLGELLYLRLLFMCWNEGGLDLGKGNPWTSPEQIPHRVWTRLWRGHGNPRARVWQSQGRLIARHFFCGEDGKWWNKRLLREFLNDKGSPHSTVQYSTVELEQRRRELDCSELAISASPREALRSDSAPEKPGPDRGRDEPSETPEAIRDLPLYAADSTLCRRWLEVFPAWAVAYPGVDILAEVRKAHAWEAANPKRRKVDRCRFLANWLSRAQDRGANGNGTSTQFFRAVPPGTGLLGHTSKWNDPHKWDGHVNE